MEKKWILFSLFYFFLIACLGAGLRYFFDFGFYPGPFSYNHILHTHSHIAFLGWIYPVLFICLINRFLPENSLAKVKYKIQLIVTEICIACMFIAFLLQGYAFFSILFSSVFQLLTYWFIISFLSDCRRLKVENTIGLRFIKVSFLALFLSSFGPWGLAVVNAKGLAATNLYQLCIYFYLHFQYNGWFSFAIFGLILSFSDNYPINPAKFAYYFLVFALFPGFLLSTLGLKPDRNIMVVAALAGIMQFIGIILYIYLLKGIYSKLGSWQKYMGIVAALSVFFKYLLQLISSLPVLHDFIFTNRFLIMTYLHLTFIGFISFTLLLYLFEKKWLLSEQFIAKAGISLLFTGFVTSEFLLLLIGLGNYFNNFKLYVFLLSALMPVGISLILLSQLVPPKVELV